MRKAQPLASALTPVDVRGRVEGSPARARLSPGADVRYARRALQIVAAEDPRHEYGVVDVALAGEGPLRRCVVFLQQRLLGLPVYDGRRSVVFFRRRIQLTGRAIATGALARRVPAIAAADAVRFAFRTVYGGEFEPEPPQRVATFATAEGFVAFTLGEQIRAFAHLAVFKTTRTHLAWVVELEQARHPGFELVLDALSMEILRQRTTALAATAEVHVAPEPTHAVPLQVGSEWNRRELSCRYDGDRWRVPPDAAGVVAGSDDPTRRGLNAFAIANRLLDVVARYSPRSIILEFELFTDVVLSVADVAFADRTRVVMCGVHGPPARYAVLEPTVVAHEVAHVVLNTLVGGSAFAAPFEPTGKSRAVSEGLADYLGLTVWNDACRSASPAEPVSEILGSWLLAGGRDYSEFLAGRSQVIPASSSPHAVGRALCGALLLARHAVAARAGGEAIADDIVWRALITALPHLPHQGEQPSFCCVRSVVIEASGPASPATPLIVDAFDRMNIRATCTHREVQ